MAASACVCGCLHCCCQLKCASMAESLIMCVRISVTGLRFSLANSLALLSAALALGAALTLFFARCLRALCSALQWLRSALVCRRRRPRRAGCWLVWPEQEFRRVYFAPAPQPLSSLLFQVCARLSPARSLARLAAGRTSRQADGRTDGRADAIERACRIASDPQQAKPPVGRIWGIIRALQAKKPATSQLGASQP